MLISKVYSLCIKHKSDCGSVAGRTYRAKTADPGPSSEGLGLESRKVVVSREKEQKMFH